MARLPRRLAPTPVSVNGERVRTAEALRRRLLPDPLPELPGWQSSALYRAASGALGLGGDFYEAFAADGRQYVLIGDAIGKGAEAAVLTTLVRQSLRTALSITGDMRLAFAELDSQLAAAGETSLCTALLLRLERDAVTIASAGHPLPLLVRRGEARPVGAYGPLLGAGLGSGWRQTRLRMARGDALALYTDGVTDARGADGRFGEQRLSAALALAPSTASELIAAVSRALGAFDRGDDTSVVALLRTG